MPTWPLVGRIDGKSEASRGLTLFSGALTQQSRKIPSVVGQQKPKSPRTAHEGLLEHVCDGDEIAL